MAVFREVERELQILRHAIEVRVLDGQPALYRVKLARDPMLLFLEQFKRYRARVMCVEQLLALSGQPLSLLKQVTLQPFGVLPGTIEFSHKERPDLVAERGLESDVAIELLD